MTLKEIQSIIKDFENSELTILELEYKDVKIKLSKNKDNNVLVNEENNNNNLLNKDTIITPKINVPEEEIRSPLVGTFYAASSPDKEPYVNIGDKVKKGDVV